MGRLSNLRRALKIAGAARELAIETRRFHWEMKPGATFFLQAEQADIQLASHDRRELIAKVELQAGFSWQLATDSDEAGVYIVARRKALIGGVARARFELALPRDVHISLKLARCRLRFDELSATLDFPRFPAES